MTRYLGLWVLLGLLLPPLGFAQEIEQEIATEVQALSARHFTQCGTDYFSQYINPVAKGTSKRNQALATTITQYQGFERIAKEATLARADELNGVQWRVEVSFQAESTRTYGPQPGRQSGRAWSEWQERGPWGARIATFMLEKKAGRVRSQAFMGLVPDQYPAPDCRDIPN